VGNLIYGNGMVGRIAYTPVRLAPNMIREFTEQRCSI